MLILVFKGLIIGLLIAIPVGPAGVMAMRRAIVDGPRAGFIAGLGSSVADALYLILLQIGISTLSFTLYQTSLIRGGGGLMVVAIGLRMLIREATDRSEVTRPREQVNAFFSAFLLSLINPTILLSLTVLVASFELGEASHSPQGSLLLILSVFSGSVLLWLLLSRGVLSIPNGPAVHKLAGAAFVAIGSLLLLHALCL